MEPMLCRSEDALPVGRGWIYEPKFDGFRALISRTGDHVSIRGRRGGALERSFRELVPAAVQYLPDDTVIDGELVICDEQGVCFDALLARLGASDADGIASVMAFDVLRVRGTDVRDEPFVRRRELLEGIVGGPFVTVPQTEDVDVAARWLDGFAVNGVEGVVAKRRNDRYVSGQRRLVKVKRRRTIDCVIGGWRGDAGPEALLLGLHEDGGLRYIGQTVRLSVAERSRAAELLQRADESPFDGPRPGWSRWDGFRFAEDEWVRVVPNVVAEVSFTQLSFGMFRHAVRLLRWRPDRTAESCLADQLPAR
jgi:ATP-dependent DNA ligase